MPRIFFFLDKLLMVEDSMVIPVLDGTSYNIIGNGVLSDIAEI